MSVLFPTTGRPERAESCLRGLRETAPDVEVIAAVDADPETACRIESLVDVLDVAPSYRGLPESWNACLSHSHGDVVFAADDLVFKPGWLEAAQEGMSRHEGGWGLVGFNDGHAAEHEAQGRGRDFATHYLLSRRFVVEVLGGVVAWSCYAYGKNDRETNDRAKAAGRHTWAADALVLHEHYLWGTRERDETDERAMVERNGSDAVYEQRKAAGFPNDYPPIIEE